MHSQSSTLQRKNTKYRIYFHLKCNLKLTYSDLVTINTFQPTLKIEEQKH